MAPASTESRATLVGSALRVEWITLAWMIIEAMVALWAGLAARSILVLAFGVDSLIELFSATVLLWRLVVELRRGRDFPEHVERLTSRIAGGLLFLLAVYVIASAGWSLWAQRSAEFSMAGFVVSIAAIPIMLVLSRRKLQIAEGLGSRALRADAIESVTCAWLAGAVVIGLAAQVFFKAWWIDAAAALCIVPLLVREGLEAWEEDDDDGDDEP